MADFEEKVNLMLISARANRAIAIRELMRQSGVDGVIRRLPPSTDAVDCARQRLAYRNKPLPDLFVFDYAIPDERSTAVLKQMAFGPNKASVPVVLLTSPQSLKLLDAGEIDGGKAVMFSPTGLASFVAKMCCGQREAFFKALKTLFQFGPVLVRMPAVILEQDAREFPISA